jgi:hypothetical protein
MDLQSLHQICLGGIRGHMSEMRYTDFARRVSCLGNHCGNLFFPTWIAGVAGGPQADRLSEVRE